MSIQAVSFRKMERKHVLVGPSRHEAVLNVSLGKQLYDKLKQRNRNEIAFKNDITDEWVSVGKVLDDSARLALTLTNLGFTSDSLIAICANNHVNYPIIILGALYAGVPLALMSSAYTEYELENLLKIVEAELIFCSNMNAELVANVKSKNNSLKKVVVIDEEQTIPGVEIFDNFLAPSIANKYANSEFSIKEVNIRQQAAFILFSSGTTGLPKAVSITHYSICATLIALNDPALNLPIKPDVGLGVLPFFHIYGFYQIMTTITEMRPLILLEHFNPFDYLRCIEKYKIDVVIGVPVLIQFLAKSPIVDEYNLSSLKEATCASAPIDEDTIQVVQKRLKLQGFRQAYGCTEAHMLVTITPAVGRKPGSVGRVAPGTMMFIRDIETGEALPPNREGEICSKSDMMMKGYYKNDAATRETFTEDGWLRSGDIGYCDEEGNLFVVDRLKELIKYKGFQVAPAELEAVLMKNTKIADAGVIGKPDLSAGEIPVAFVVKQEGASPTKNEIMHFVASFLTKRKHLHDVYFIDEIPRTRSGKIMRRELKKILKDMSQSKL